MACRNHVEIEEGVRPCSRCGAFFCSDCLVAIHGRPYCAGCKTEQLLDLRSGTDQWTLQYAHLGRRFLAMMVDQFIWSFGFMILVAGPIILLFIYSPNHPDSPLPMALLGVAFLIGIGGIVTYEALMLAKRNGQTLGKMALKIRVVRPDGTPISMGQAWGRAFTRLLLIHVLQLVNYLPAFFTKEKTCVHDMFAKTRVVRAD